MHEQGTGASGASFTIDAIRSAKNPALATKKQKLVKENMRTKWCSRLFQQIKTFHPIPVGWTIHTSLYLQTNQHVSRVHREIGLGNHGTSNIHESVQQAAESRRSLLQGNY